MWEYSASCDFHIEAIQINKVSHQVNICNASGYMYSMRVANVTGTDPEMQDVTFLHTRAGHITFHAT